MQFVYEFTKRKQAPISSFSPGVNGATEKTWLETPDSLLLALLNLRKCFWGMDHKSPCECVCVSVCVIASRCVSGCHVALSISALLCQEMRTQGKPLAAPADWISPLNLNLCWKLQGRSVSAVLAEPRIDFVCRTCSVGVYLK